MQSTSMHSLAFAPHFPAPLRLRFGFPRAWLPRQLCSALAEQLYVGTDACQAGYYATSGSFVALAADEDFDGPDFVLRLSYALADHPVLDHDIALYVAILDGRYQLQVAGRRFDIAFLPSADTAQIANAARWILRSIDSHAPAR